MSEVGTRPVPLGLTERDVDDAIERLTAQLGADKVITDPTELREFRDPFQVRTSDDYAASAVVMPTTVEEIQAIVAIANATKRPAVDARPGPQQRLRRARPARERVDHRVAAEHEQGARDQREARLRRRRAGRALVRPLRGDQGRRAQADGLHRRSRVGQRHRQLARQRRDLHALRRRPGVVVRDGGRPAERRADAHRHGRDAGQQGLAHLQAQPGPRRRPHVHAVQLRHRHEDGRLAHAGARDVHAAVASPPEGRRPRRGNRRHARAHARRHAAHEPADHERHAAGRRALRAHQALGGPQHPDPAGRPGPGSARSWASGAGSCASRCTATRPSSTTATRRSRTPSSRGSPARRCGAPSTPPTRSPTSRIPANACRAASPASISTP